MPKIETTKAYLTIKDTASLVGVTTRTVAKWLTAGLPHIKLGGLIRILPEDLRAWILLHRKSSLPVIRALPAGSRGGTPMGVFSAEKFPTRKATSSLFLGSGVSGATKP